MQFEYRPASVDELERIWAKNIARNPGDDRWVHWKRLALRDNGSGRSLTFVIVADGDPVGEGTLMFDPGCEAIANRPQLADRATIANVDGLRVEKEYEGQGHVSKLMRVMEQYARDAGYAALSIGVEAREARNVAIYLHWGYDQLIHYEEEEGTMVLYYSKKL